MKLIFDENVPLPLGKYFSNHILSTIQEEGWAGVDNGEIIELIDGHFDVFILADKNLRYQQNLSSRRIAMVELPTNRWPILESIAKKVVTAVEQSKPGSYTIVAP